MPAKLIENNFTAKKFSFFLDITTQITRLQQTRSRPLKLGTAFVVTVLQKTGSVIDRTTHNIEQFTSDSLLTTLVVLQIQLT